VTGAIGQGFVVVSMAGAFRGYIRSVCVRADRRGAGLGILLRKTRGPWLEFRPSPRPQPPGST
jgi:hypothetical protein